MSQETCFCDVKFPETHLVRCEIETQGGSGATRRGEGARGSPPRRHTPADDTWQRKLRRKIIIALILRKENLKFITKKRYVHQQCRYL